MVNERKTRMMMMMMITMMMIMITMKKKMKKIPMMKNDDIDWMIEVEMDYFYPSIFFLWHDLSKTL